MSESIAERTTDLDWDNQKGFQLEEAFQLGLEEFSWELLFRLKRTV